MDWTAWFGSPGQTLATAFVVATYTTKTMVPLRIFGILTNLVMIGSATFTHQHGTLLLHMFLLPMNSYRLYQMLKLIKGVKTSLHDDLNMDWLKPFMTRSLCKKGDVLFAKDAIADAMYYTVSGLQPPVRNIAAAHVSPADEFLSALPDAEADQRRQNLPA
jgi:hypothetical protein